MAFVLDKEGNYLQVFGTTSGGSGDNNFIPNDTVISVKLDGSGDFTSFPDAISSLDGKWSNGQVTIELGSGTFDTNGTVNFNPNKFNIPRLSIKGSGKDNTIINGKNIPDWNGVININQRNSIVEFENLTINSENTTTASCVRVNSGNVQIYQTVSITNGNTGVNVFGNATLLCNSTNLYISGVSGAGVSCQAGGNAIFANTKFYLDTIGTAFSINIGTIKMWNCTKSSATSVTNLFSQTKNTFTSQGYILSELS